MSVDDDIAMRASEFTRGGAWGGGVIGWREICDASLETMSRIAGATFAIIISTTTNRADYGITIKHGRLCFCFLPNCLAGGKNGYSLLLG